MAVNLLTGISTTMGDPSFRNWSELKNFIPTAHLTESELDLAQAHDSTFYKIRFADYHLFILGQIYDPKARVREGEIQNWVRAEMHSTIYNLYSALDSLAYEINLAYGFGIKPRSAAIHHDHRNNNIVNGCLRCELKKINDDLHRYIDKSLNEPWFDYLRKLRNQITHRHFPVWNIGIAIGGGAPGNTFRVKLPDNPENMNPGQSDYSQNLEVREYCQDTREKVRKVTEDVYPLITPKIKENLKRK